MKNARASSCPRRDLFYLYTQPCEMVGQTMWSVFTRTSALSKVLVWGSQNVSFQGVFPPAAIEHLFLLHVACLIIKFYFNPCSHGCVWTPDTGDEGTTVEVSHAANVKRVVVSGRTCLCASWHENEEEAWLMESAPDRVLFRRLSLPRRCDLISLNIPGCALYSGNGATDPFRHSCRNSGITGL